MPKRNRDKLIEGSQLQGMDSFVRVKIVSVEEALSMQLPPLVIPEGADDDERARLEAEYNTASELNAREKLCQYVLDWNWVDDNDQPLEKPFNNPEVFRKLTGQEIRFLVMAVSGSDDLRAQKKRR
jgi:hypothetical protein